MAESSANLVTTDASSQKSPNVVQKSDSLDTNKTDKVMEPILLEDLDKGEEPWTLLNLLKFFKDEGVTPSKADFIVGCIYILMLEYGFIPTESQDTFEDCEFDYQRILILSQKLPHNWKKSNNLYTFSFVLAPYPLYICSLMCIPSHDDIVVNCLVRNIEALRISILVDTLTYFLSSTSEVMLTHVQNLKSLSLAIKNKIAYPVKFGILKENNQRFNCLEDIPPEVLIRVVCCLENVKSVLNLGSTNTLFQNIIQNVPLWKQYLNKDFGIDVSSENVTVNQLMRLYASYHLRRRTLPRRPLTIDDSFFC